MKKTLCTLLFLLTASALLHAADGQESREVMYPLGIDSDAVIIPENNPLTKEKIELGKMLYFDRRLSSDGTISCASCHNPKTGFADSSAFSKGVQGKLGTRNSPTVLNSALSGFQFWDGRAPSLEEQAKGPMENPVEMAHTLDKATEKIASIPGYRPYFEAAFGDEKVTIERIVQAIASFERTLFSGNSSWDRYVYEKDKKALSDSAARGLELFEGKALCTRCHTGFNLSDGLFHNLGVGMNRKDPDLGRYLVTGKEKDKGAFKTPTLRDVSRTAPYMHDGSMKTLEEVVDLYDRGGEANPWLDPKVQPLHLTAQEKKDLVEFMKSLEGDWKPVEEPVLPSDK